MPSTFLNLLRNGPQSWNVNITFTGSGSAFHTANAAPYVGTLGAASPMLFRFSPTLTSEVVSAAKLPALAFTAATFGLSTTDPLPRSIWVGVQYVAADEVRFVFAYQPFFNSLPTQTVTGATTNSNIAALTSGSSQPIVWLGKYAGLTRNAGLWVTTTATFLHCGPGGHPGPRILSNISEV